MSRSFELSDLVISVKSDSCILAKSVHMSSEDHARPEIKINMLFTFWPFSLFAQCTLDTRVWRGNAWT